MRKPKVIQTTKPDAIKALLSFDWTDLIDRYLKLAQGEMLVLDPSDFRCTAFALRELVKGAINRQQYFSDNIPAATTHIDERGNVLLMKSVRVDVRVVDDSYSLPRRSPYVVAGNGSRRIIAPNRRRYRYR